MTAPEVTAVMLCWNDVARVRALVRRLAALEPAPGRVLVLDNGSREDVAGELAGEACEVIALGRNLGFATAINRGIEAATAASARLDAATAASARLDAATAASAGSDAATAASAGSDAATAVSWVWVLNTDVELPADALAALLRTASRDARCGMAAAVLVEPDGRVLTFGGGRVNLWTGSSRHVQEPDEGCDYLVGACLLLRTQMLREIGLFDESYFFYWEDVDLSFRAREAGWTLRVASDCRVVHAEGSTLGRWSAERWYLLFRGMRRFLESRSPLPRVATALGLAWHSAAMLRHRRTGALRGAWRAVAEGRSR